MLTVRKMKIIKDQVECKIMVMIKMINMIKMVLGSWVPPSHLDQDRTRLASLGALGRKDFP